MLRFFTAKGFTSHLELVRIMQGSLELVLKGIL